YSLRLGLKNWVFNRVLCPSYQGFRIYRETLSRFSCAASSVDFYLSMCAHTIYLFICKKAITIDISYIMNYEECIFIDLFN
ncbi:hypothetical protein ACT6QE_00320, partial [Staphylococcus aureus]